MSLRLDVKHCNSKNELFVSLYLLQVLSEPPPGNSVPLTLLVQYILHSTGIFQKCSGIVFDYLHLIIKLIFPRS